MQSELNRKTEGNLIRGLLLLLPLIAYYKIGTLDFVYFDEDYFLLRESHVNQGLSWESIRWAFSGFFLMGMDQVSYWQPLTFLTHMLDFELYGLDATGPHFTNLLIHLLNIQLVFHLLRHLAGNLRWAAFCAGLFAIHPLNVEAVCWIMERKGLLSATFSLGSLLYYIRWTQSKLSRDYLISLLAFAMSLMSKVNLLLLPVAMLLLDLWPLNRCAWEWRPLTRIVWEKVPFGLLSLLMALQTVFHLSHLKGIQNLKTLSMEERIYHSLYGYTGYISNFFFPFGLTAYYPLFKYNPGAWEWFMVIILFVPLTLLFWFSRKNAPALMVGWAWFLGLLLPVIGLVQAGGQSMADRYMYIPMIGILIILAWSGERISRWGAIPRRIAITVGGLLLCGAGVLTVGQVQQWKSGLTLFEHALKHTDRNYLAHVNYGIELMRVGENKKAEECFYTAMDINPEGELAYYSLGIIQMQEGSMGKALECFKKTLEINPKHSGSYYQMGHLFLESGRTNEALKSWTQSIKYDERKSSSPSLALLYLKLNQIPEAKFYFQQSAQFGYDPVLTHYNLGTIEVGESHWDLAMAHYFKALKADPEHPPTLYNLGNLYRRLNRLEDARNQYERLIQIQPNHFQAHNNLGILHARSGQWALAIREYELAIKINPRYAEAHFNMGIAFLRMNQVAKAKGCLLQTLKINPQYREANDLLAKLKEEAVQKP